MDKEEIRSIMGELIRLQAIIKEMEKSGFQWEKVQEISDALSSADTELGVDEDELRGELEGMMLDIGSSNVTPSMFPVAPVGLISTENAELHEGDSERRVLMSS